MHSPPTPHLDMKSQRKEGWAGKAQKKVLYIGCQTEDHLTYGTEVHLNAFLILAARSLIRALSHNSGRAVELLCPLSISQRQHPKFPPFISYFQNTKIWMLFFANSELLSCLDEQLVWTSSSLLASELSLTYVACKAYYSPAKYAVI